MCEWPNTTTSARSPKRAPHALEAAAARTGVVDHRDPGSLGLDHPLLGQQPAQLRAVHVAVHAHQRRPDRLELAQDLEGREVACVKQQIGPRDPLDARLRQPPRAPRQVRVGYHGDQHPGTTLTVPGARSSVDRALPSGGRGRRFESFRAYRPSPTGYGLEMSQENVELARNAVAAFNRRDVPALVELTTDDFKWVTWTGTVESTVYDGAEGLAVYFQDADIWKVLDLDAQEFRDLGDKVLVVGMFHARGGGSGAEVRAPYYSAFFVSEGKLARVLSFRTEAEALEPSGCGSRRCRRRTSTRFTRPTTHSTDATSLPSWDSSMLTPRPSRAWLPWRAFSTGTRGSVAGGKMLLAAWPDYQVEVVEVRDLGHITLGRGRGCGSRRRQRHRREADGLARLAVAADEGRLVRFLPDRSHRPGGSEAAGAARLALRVKSTISPSSRRGAATCARRDRPFGSIGSRRPGRCCARPPEMSCSSVVG